MKNIGGCSIALSVALTISACATKTAYSPPINPPASPGTQIAKMSFEQAWSKIIANAGRAFFVVNNIDKSSGYLNISYSGDPSEFLDCGTFNIKSENIKGRMDGTYPLSKEIQTIHMRTGLNVDTYLRHEMNVEGRANIVVMRIGDNETKMDVNVRYVVKRHMRYIGGFSPLPPGANETISFNSGQIGYFQPGNDGSRASCVSTGTFERTLIGLLN